MSQCQARHGYIQMDKDTHTQNTQNKHCDPNQCTEWHGLVTINKLHMLYWLCLPHINMCMHCTLLLCTCTLLLSYQLNAILDMVTTQVCARYLQILRTILPTLYTKMVKWNVHNL